MTATDRKLEFLEFAYDRQNIYHLRHIENQPAPWTGDQILQTYRFCNSYRHLDRGSLYIIHEVIENRSLSLFEKYINIILYRIFNIDQFFSLVIDGPITVENYDFKKLESLMDEARKGGAIFNPAYVVTHVTIDPEYRSTEKHVQYLKLMENLIERKDEIMKGFDILVTRPEDAGRKDITELLLSVPRKVAGVGPFIAGQILADLSYCEDTWFTTDDYCIVGPGAISSFAYIAGEDKLSQKKARELCRVMSDYQEEGFRILKEKTHKDWLDISIKEGGVYPGSYLSVMDIQNVGCEFRKYRNYKKGKQRKRYYR